MADDGGQGRLCEKSKNNTEKMEEDDEEEDFFEVEQILGKSKVKGVVTYKVRWKGYGQEEDTWEPIDNLDSCQELIDEFNKKREESLKQKAEERKMRQAMMEGRVSSSESTEETSSTLYPPNFKNSFWKDLEAGRIDVFDSNMYSKVKERSVKLQSLKEYQEQELETDRKSGDEMKKPKVQKSDTTPFKVQKSDTTSFKVQKSETTPLKVQKSETNPLKVQKSDTTPLKVQKSETTPLKVTKKSPNVSQKCKSFTGHTSHIDKQPCVSSKSRKKQAETTSTTGAFTIQTDDSDSDSDCNSPCVDIKSENPPNTDTDKEAGQRKGIKLIMKLPKPPGDNDGVPIVTTKHVESSDLYKPDLQKKKSKVSKQSKAIKLATEVEVKLIDINVEKITKTEDSDLISDVLNKDHNISNTITTHRKRKLSGSSDVQNGPSSSVIMDSFTNKVKIEESVNSPYNNHTGVNKENNSAVKQVIKPVVAAKTIVKTEVLSVPKDNCPIIIKPEFTETPTTPTVENLNCGRTDFSYGGYNNWSVPNSCVYTNYNQSTNSQNNQGTSASKQEPLFDFDLDLTFRSHALHNNTTISQDCTSTPTVSHNIASQINSGSYIPNYNTNPIHSSSYDFSQTVLDYNSSQSGCVITRRDSETVDSGIASPASEKSLGLSRSDSMNPFEDVLSESILPFIPQTEKIPEKEPEQDFDIDLDEIDWDLFAREVKLEPITISDCEFVKAVLTGDYELVKRAFMGEGKYNLEHADQSGKTLLMHAVQHRYDDIADLLIEHGANINSQMTNGFTPLMIACQFAELCTVNLLIELGAKVNMQAYNGESALMIAVRRGDKHITWLLLECGANFSLKSHTGYTALSYSRAFNHLDTESTIRTHVDRVMSEFHRQVSVTLNNLANIREMVFPPQVFNISEEELFHVNFSYTSKLPHIHGLGYILFLGHAMLTSEEIKCRFTGPCAVKAACLNGVTLSPLTQEGNFVLAFNPVTQGNNQLTINTIREMDMKQTEKTKISQLLQELSDQDVLCLPIEIWQIRHP